jgi:hypothetical protein
MLQSDGYVRMIPALDAKFEAFDCALRKIKKTEFRTKLGFVGNEVAEPEKKNQ